MKNKVVCLCGSVRFVETFKRASEKLTDAGYIVLSTCRVLSPEQQGKQPELKRKLDKLHLEKIDMSDWVLILNVNNYIGFSTKNEIEHAVKAGKPVFYITSFDLDNIKEK